MAGRGAEEGDGDVEAVRDQQERRSWE